MEKWSEVRGRKRFLTSCVTSTLKLRTCGIKFGILNFLQFEFRLYSLIFRDNPEQEKAKLTDQSHSHRYSHTQIRNELLYNFEKRTSPKQGRNINALQLNGNEDSATEVERTHHESAIEVIAPANSFAGKASPLKLPGDWRILEINELATEVENCGVEPEIIREHLIQNHSNITRKIKSEKKSLVLPSNWQDKIRDELIEDLCLENKFGKELLESELQQSEEVSPSPTKLKLPTEWRTMTRETLAEMYGIMLENR